MTHARGINFPLSGEKRGLISNLVGLRVKLNYFIKRETVTSFVISDFTKQPNYVDIGWSIAIRFTAIQKFFAKNAVTNQV